MNCESSSGGGIDNFRGTLRVVNSIFQGNRSRTGGGAIRGSEAMLIVSNSIFTGNAAASSGGAIDAVAGTAEITDSLFSANSILQYGHSGGAVRFSGGILSISRTRFTGNTSVGSGGALDLSGSSANFGIFESEIDHNTAASGGGIRFDSGTLNVANSTFSFNTASFRGGGLLTNGGVANGRGFDLLRERGR